MRRGLAISAFVFAALTTAAGQAGEPALAPGGPEDLRGATRIYVSPTAAPPGLLGQVVKEILKKEPRLRFVAVREGAEVWLRFTVSLRRNVNIIPSAPDASGRGRDTQIYNTLFQLEGEVIRVGGGGGPRLAGRIERSGGIKSVGGKFAEEFVRLYRKANPAASAPARGRGTAGADAPPRFAGGGKRDEAPAVAGGEAARPGGRPQTSDEVVTVDTSLVLVHASVTDKQGRPVGSLRREDFAVSEDGVEQEMAFFEPVESPFTVLLLLDISGSVRTKLEEMTAAANDFVARLRPDDRLIAISFGSEVRVLAGPVRVGDVRGRGLSIPPAGGGTRLYDALDYAFAEHVGRLPGRKAVVLLTDGVDGGSSFLADAEGTARAAEELDALIYVVRYDTLEGEAAVLRSRIPSAPAALSRLRRDYEHADTYLKALASNTGGRVFDAAGGDLGPAFASVIDELGRQYSLGYYPRTHPSQGQRRRIEVRVNVPTHVVRARDGYSVAAPGVKTAGP